MPRHEIEEFEAIPNVGPATARDFRQLGLRSPADLIDRDPYAMYDELCAKTKSRQDPCVIDVFIAATRYMQGAPPRPWWAYTPERKAELAAREGRR